MIETSHLPRYDRGIYALRVLRLDWQGEFVFLTDRAAPASPRCPAAPEAGIASEGQLKVVAAIWPR